ncbi:hypothetical protein M0R45_026863 [Rubus argutus]|uniref:Uncharacterized protein n=1 Tax=Rubus argutus TaxID=59490 RepID=A0AAW1WYK3_RUBAR
MAAATGQNWTWQVAGGYDKGGGELGSFDSVIGDGGWEQRRDETRAEAVVTVGLHGQVRWQKRAGLVAASTTTVRGQSGDNLKTELGTAKEEATLAGWATSVFLFFFLSPVLCWIEVAEGLCTRKRRHVCSRGMRLWRRTNPAAASRLGGAGFVRL